jgi:hypothetical protein
VYILTSYMLIKLFQRKPTCYVSYKNIDFMLNLHAHIEHIPVHAIFFINPFSFKNIFYTYIYRPGAYLDQF